MDPETETFTPAVERAAELLIHEAETTGLIREDVRNGLAAALPTECHEAVVPEWADGEEMPCNSPHVVGFRTDDEGCYPVCAEHMRLPMISLRVALLGADS